MKKSWGNDMNPREVIQQQFQQMHNQFAEQEQILQRTPMSDEDFTNSMAELQSKYVQAKSKFDSSTAELDTVERLTQQGLITPEAGEQAMFKMVMPPEATQAMYPRQATERRPSRPLTPGQTENFNESILEHAKSAPSIPWYQRPGRADKTQASLVDAYMKWRERIQYDAYEPHHQKQLDVEWDSVMAGDDEYDWNPNSPGVSILRTKGPLGSAIVNKKFKTPTRMSGAGPMQSSIAKQTPQQQTEQRVRVVGSDGRVGTIPASQLREALKSGYKKL